MKNLKIKNKYKLVLGTILSLFLMTSCDEEETTFDPVDFNSQKFVAFDDTSKSVSELPAAALDISAFYAVDAGSISDIAVPFIITSDNAVEGVDYMVVDNRTSLNFSSSNYTDTIQIMPIDNFITDGDKTITITLMNNGVNVGYPGPDANNSSIIVTIIDNDCPFSVEGIGNANFGGSDNSSGDEGPNASQIMTSYDGTNLLIEGIAYGWLTNTGFWDEVIVDSFPVIANIDSISGDITIDLQNLCTTTWLGDLQPAYSISATGNYDSCGETLTLNWDLFQNGAVLRSYTEAVSVQ